MIRETYRDTQPWATAGIHSYIRRQGTRFHRHPAWMKARSTGLPWSQGGFGLSLHGKSYNISGLVSPVHAPIVKNIAASCGLNKFYPPSHICSSLRLARHMARLRSQLLMYCWNILGHQIFQKWVTAVRHSLLFSVHAVGTHRSWSRSCHKVATTLWCCQWIGPSRPHVCKNSPALKPEAWHHVMYEANVYFSKNRVHAYFRQTSAYYLVVVPGILGVWLLCTWRNEYDQRTESLCMCVCMCVYTHT